MAKFVKGQSGNPGGRPKANHRLKELAQARTEEALNTLVEIMGDENAPHSARVTAACAVLDRGHGKPMQMTEITGKDGEELFKPIVSDNELARRIAFILTKPGDKEAEKQEIH